MISAARGRDCGRAGLGPGVQEDVVRCDWLAARVHGQWPWLRLASTWARVACRRLPSGKVC